MRSRRSILRHSDSFRRRSTMELISILLRDGKSLRRDVLWTVVVSGMANATLLAVINAASKRGGMQWRYLFMFAAAVALYVICLKASSAMVNRLFANVVHGMRVRLADRLHRAELPVFDAVGRGAIYNAVTRETTTILEAGDLAVGVLQAGVLVLFAAAYIAVIAPAALVIIAIFTALGVAVVQHNRALTEAVFRRTTEREIDYLSAITDAIGGFKEAKMSLRRREEILAHLEVRSADVAALRARTAELYTRTFLFTQVSFYILIGAIVFVLPRVVPTTAGSVSALSISVLFVIGPMTAIVAAVPELSRAAVATSTVLAIDRALGEGTRARRDDTLAAFPSFSRLDLERLRFTYRGDEGETFRIGPLDWSVRRGEMVFIVGGNGSGKSTFLHLLTGLHEPESGRIVVDGNAVGEDNLASYRELFAAVFADFHIFDRLHGVDAETERVETWLRTMQLDGKTSFDGERFTNLELSTGQRKRLALIASILQERPILILDELAADQDPAFRRFLYETLLPRLRAEGKTIVAVTHDDRYFNVADTVYRMEDGFLQRLTP